MPQNDCENANTHAHGDVHLVMLAHLRRQWSLSGREFQRFSGNETPIFYCAGREETEANGVHRSDRTLDRTRSLFDRTHPVSAQRLRVSQYSDRTRWRVRLRSTGRIRSWWVLTGL
jgi:hypothetical protein